MHWKEKVRNLKACTNKNNFIQIVNTMYPDQYEYDKTVYIDLKKEVKLKCKKHGYFIISPYDILYKNKKCPNCIKYEETNFPEKIIEIKDVDIKTNGKTTTLENLIEKIKKIHKNNYKIYEETYINTIQPVKFYCNVHNGDFWIRPYSLLKGNKCKQCSITERNSNKILNYSNAFIDKCTKKYGDIYDYSNSIYTKSNEYINVYCKKHDLTFRVLPYKHIGGQICPKCPPITHKYKMFNNKNIIERFIEKHGNKYNYDSVIYSNMKEKIKIYCNRHKEYFFQTPDNHLSGYGCVKCGIETNIKNKTITYSDWVDKLRISREDKGLFYDYSKAEKEYINLTTKVTIYCSLHNNYFKQTPGRHLAGSGCYFCGIEKRTENLKLNTNDFIERSKEQHGYDKFDYSLVDYKNTITPVVLICKLHGEFSILPGNHLYNHIGCPKCQKEILSNRLSLSNEEYLNRVFDIYGDKFNYNLINYKTSNKNIEVICQTHGVFKVKPLVFLSGSGCPKCRGSNPEKLISSYLEEFNIRYAREVCFPNVKFRYDFKLLDYKILIEYHGIQHYEPVKIFGGIEGFNIRKKYDIIKKDIANKYGYKLIVLSYKLKTKEIKQVLIDNLKKNNVSI